MDVACNDYMVRSSAHTYTYSLCLDETQQYLSEPMAVVAVAIYTGIEHRIVQSSKSSKSIHQPIPTINGTTPHCFFAACLPVSSTDFHRVWAEFIAGSGYEMPGLITPSSTLEVGLSPQMHLGNKAR